MFHEYIQAMLMILIAEMGDKTQILAMAFATKYKIRQIVIGVALGAFLNHGLAILLGSLLTRVIPMELLQLIAGLMFIGFAFWSLQVDDEGEEEKNSAFGPIITVALAFFIGELGDKTQLTALTLGASSQFPFFILMGTVTGMVLTSLLGILIGAKLGHKIPEMQLKLGAFTVFMVFGLEKLINSPYTRSLNVSWLVVGLVVVAIAGFIKIQQFIQDVKVAEKTALRAQAQGLYEYVHKIKEDVDALCLGESHCQVCKGGMCTVGFMKDILARSSRGEVIEPYEISQINHLIERDFDLNLTREILGSLRDYYEKYPEEFIDNIMLTNLRHALERILFGAVLKDCRDFMHYQEKLIELDDTFKLKKL